AASPGAASTWPISHFTSTTLHPMESENRQIRLAHSDFWFEAGLRVVRLPRPNADRMCNLYRYESAIYPFPPWSFPERVGIWPDSRSKGRANKTNYHHFAARGIMDGTARRARGATLRVSAHGPVDRKS